MIDSAPLLSFYLHIPYCLRRCGYCDFNTYTPGELRTGSDLSEVSQGYIDLMIAEIDQSPAGIEIPTIFFGGGTPTLMEPEDLGRVLRHLEIRNGLTADCEITIEANPDTVTAEKLERLRAIGINRISFGMQSATTHVLKTLDRTHNPENVLKATAGAVAAGFEQISVDLIYGAPGESVSDWTQTIETALALPITHISAYALIVEDGTKLGAQVKRGEIVMPDEDETADKYLLADSKFSEAGLNWYEISNWAKPGAECKHNVAYWEGKNWWGVGPGAHSHLDGRRWWNVKHPTAYRDRVAKGQSPLQGEEILTASEKESERVMLEIRMPAGIELSTLGSAAAARISNYLASGHINAQIWEQGRLSLTLSGRLIADRIVREILV
ncbi:MAG: radical SAM family heme chaperone HemW [Actinomycetes bacterium]